MDFLAEVDFREGLQGERAEVSGECIPRASLGCLAELPAAHGAAVRFISIEAFLYVHLPGSLCFEERIKDLLSSAAKDKTQWGSWSAIREE